MTCHLFLSGLPIRGEDKNTFQGSALILSFRPSDLGALKVHLLSSAHRPWVGFKEGDQLCGATGLILKLTALLSALSVCRFDTEVMLLSSLLSGFMQSAPGPS